MCELSVILSSFNQYSESLPLPMVWDSQRLCVMSPIISEKSPFTGSFFDAFQSKKEHAFDNKGKGMMLNLCIYANKYLYNSILNTNDYS